MSNNLFRPLGHKELLILTELLGEKLNKLPYKFNLLEEVGQMRMLIVGYW